MFLLIALIDWVLIMLLLMFILTLPTPWNSVSINNNLKPLILLEKKVVNEYIIENWTESIDKNKKYCIYYNKINDKLKLKEWIWKIQVWALWFYIWTQSYWKNYYFKIKDINPLIIERFIK